MTFPFQIQTPPEHTAVLPDRVDVVVIGGGIIGVMTAWELAKAGSSVVVLEKGRIGAEQSSRNWGWIRNQGRDPSEIPIMQEAAAMWRQMAKDIPEDIGLRQTGVCYLASAPQGVGRFEDWVPFAKDHGLDSQVLSAKQTADLFPDAAIKWAGALWTASDMKAEPWVALPAIARAAVRDGVTIIEGCAVRGLDISGGAVTGVNTEKGRIECAETVLAGGAWSQLLLRRHGLTIPPLAVRATVAATAPLPDVFQGGAVDDRLAFRRRADGGYTLAPEGFHELYIGPDAFRALAGYTKPLLKDPLGTKLLPAAPRGYPDAWGTPRKWDMDSVSPFERMRILNPLANRAKVAKLARDFAATFPKLGEVQIKTAWAGMIDTMPDVVPIVDRAPVDGLTVVTGMCGHGFGIGPAFGRIAARIVRSDDVGYDMHRFRYGRFTDGSKLMLGPNL
ncbi:MAG: FAD-binding oxidoreductase [Yoonia sp.]|nr:FAD-binding oxidoreductase [Yoonia sp.]